MRGSKAPESGSRGWGANHAPNGTSQRYEGGWVESGVGGGYGGVEYGGPQGPAPLSLEPAPSLSTRPSHTDLGEDPRV